MLLFSTGNYDAPTNLAYNEACLNNVRSGYPILRVFTFSEPGVILAKRESLWDVRDDFHYVATRRNTGGSVIYVDSGTLGYTLLFHKDDLDSGRVMNVYKRLTAPLVAGLKEKGLPAELGNLFSIRLDGKVVAGHAQYNRKDSVQYDGIIHLKKPNVERIGEAIKLRTLSHNGSAHVICVDGEVYGLDGSFLGREEDFELNHIRDERQEISDMPGLEDFGLGKEEYTEIIRTSFERLFGMNSKEELPDVDQEAENLRRNKYTNKDWIKKGSKRALGHCFVDLIEPETTQ